MLVLKNITKRFGNRVILNKINASYPSRGMFGIYGESGSGKSTLLNIISLLDNDYTGTLKINNLDPKKDKINISRTIGIIYQHFNLLNNLTSYENVELACSLIGINNRKAIENTLKSVNLDKKLWHKKVINLSGGEKERVAIARAIINNPSVIVADEPTGSLDSSNSENTFTLLKKLSEKSLVVIVSHNLDLLNKYCLKVEEIHQLTYNYNDNKYSQNVMDNNDISDKILIKNHFRENKFKYFLITLSQCFSMLFLIISSSLMIFANDSKDKLTTNFVDKNVFKISKIENVKSTDTIFTFQEISRPSISEMESLKKILPNFSYYYDLSCAFKSSIDVIKDEKVIKGITFVPSFYQTNSFEEVVANEECYKLLNSSSFSHDFSNQVYFYDNIESYKLKSDFKIIKVIKEVGLLNSPRIYYNYEYAKKILQNTYTSTNKTVYEIIAKAKANDIISNYQMIIKLKSDEDIIKVYNIIKKGVNGFDITSNAYLIDQSFLEIKNSIALFIMIFTSVLVISNIAILLFICISIIIDSEKEMAILVSMGKEKKTYLKIYLIEMVIVTIVAFLISFILASAFNYIADIVVKKYLIETLNFSIIFPAILCLIISISIIISSMTVAFKKVNKLDLIRMLRDE